jgi:hypothetical protein
VRRPPGGTTINKRPVRWLWLDDVRDHVRDRTLSQRAGHVALVLGVHYMNGHCEAWPSQPELAAVTGYSERSVREALRELERNDLLEVSRGRPGRTSGNVYRLPREPASGAGFPEA